MSWKRGIVCLYFAIILFSFASAVDVTKSGDTVSVSSATNLYAYEVNFAFTGTPSVSSYGSFLGADTSTGSNTRGTTFSVYESKLDPTQTGTSGSGSLFSASSTGTFTLSSAELVYADGSETTLSCGDGTCNLAETTSSCAADCPSTGGGGTSGGATTTTTTTTTTTVESVGVSVSPEELNVDLIVDKVESVEITVSNDGDNDATLTMEATSELSGKVTFSPSSFVLAPGEEKVVEVVFAVREGGLLTGEILIKSGAIAVATIPTSVNVRSENFLFDVALALVWGKKNFLSGENLRLDISLLQVGPEEKVDVTANYIIKDFTGNTYFEESETFFVLGGKDYIKEISTEGLQPGKYTAGLEIVYPGAFATSSTQFSVVEKADRSLIFFIGVAVVLVAAVILVVVWAVRRGRKKAVKKKRG